ncbi:MAG: sigma-70 family RNA polymerase sigma factor [Planctomycetota bacterium]
MSDKQLDRIEQQIRLATDGDQAALASLFGHYKSQLRRMIAFRLDRKLQGRIDPSDVLQDAFLDLSKRLTEFGNKNMSFFVWLRLVAHERLLAIHREHLGAQKRDARREKHLNQNATGASSMMLAAHLLGKNTSVVGRAIRAEKKAQLEALLESMDDTDREIIALRIFEGLSNGECAEVLGLTKQTSSKRFMRAIGRLRESIEMIPGFGQ